MLVMKDERNFCACTPPICSPIRRKRGLDHRQSRLSRSVECFDPGQSSFVFLQILLGHRYSRSELLDAIDVVLSRVVDKHLRRGPFVSKPQVKRSEARLAMQFQANPHQPAFRQKAHEWRAALSLTAIDLGGSDDFASGLRGMRPGR